METRPLPPIPTPPAQRWREVRLLYLPRTVFVVGVVVAAVLWSRWVTPAALVAEAEVVGADIRSTQAGTLVALKAGMLEQVKAGQVVGQVANPNVRLLDSTLAVIRAEIAMIAATMQGVTDRQRVALEFERLQLDWMGYRVELAGLQGKLQLAEAELARFEPLHRSGMITAEAFDQIKINRDALARQSKEQAAMIAQIEPRIRGFSTPEQQAAGLSSDNAIAAAIKVQEAKLKLAEEQLRPEPLTAPIDGVVSLVLRRAGETVVPGEVIVRIHAAKPARLTGFLRQPVTTPPKPGTVATVTTRGTPRVSGQARILQTGAAMEPITPSLVAALHLPPNQPVESALRIVFAVPEGMSLLPGEHVDVSLP
jgi:multidrug resistance efflux pump